MPVFTSKKALSDEGLSSEARLGERKTSYLGAECLSLRLLPSAKSTSLVRGRLSKAPATAGTPLKTAPSKRELSAAKLLTKGVLSLYAKKHRPEAVLLSDCQKSLAEFAPAGANKVLIIFSGDMCVGENTFRLANVRVVRQRRTASALRRAAAFSNESPA